jgi:hypothetical protein
MLTGLPRGRGKAEQGKPMNGSAQAKVLLASLTECVSGRGTRYMRGWLGASNVVAFSAEPYDQGRP